MPTSATCGWQFSPQRIGPAVAVLLTAITNRDYPVIQGLVVLSALVYSLVNALADVVYGVLDPRVEVGR